jgi:phage shock protein PspC (stress-responsive transcriptional regulator)
MKKALQITIAGTLFTIEDDAYHTLDQYLQSIKKYFSTYSDHIEIEQDIEARIAERLLEFASSTQTIVTIEAVTQVISAMGTVEDFAKASGDAEDRKSEGEHETSHQDGMKRLYRNPDDVVIAGVASGIGVYFGIDPLIIRILFVVLAFITSGAMIVVYVILALIIPKAETATDKIQMKGGPMTLNSFRETVKKNSDEYLAPHSSVRSTLNKIFDIFGKLIRSFVKVVIAVVGFILFLGGAIGLFLTTFLFINVTFNNSALFADFPVTELVSRPAYYLFVVLGYMLAMVPLVFITIIGLSFIRRRRSMNSQAALGLAALWVVSFLLFGTLAVRYAPDIRQRLEALPQYQVVSHTEHTLDNFNKLNIQGVATVHLVQAPDFSIAEQGRQYDIDNVQLEVKDNTLILSQKNREKICLFCFNHGRLGITISMPKIESIETSGIVTLSANKITTESLSLTTSGVSTTDVEVTTRTMAVESSGSSHVTLHGTSPVLRVTTSGVSSFDGSLFKVRTATADASGNSHITVNASDTVNAVASGVSEIIYSGTPKVSQDTSGNARIISAQSESPY